MSELRKKTIIGAGWMVGMRMAVNLLGFITTAIMARLLTPGDYGVVALAGSAYAFFALLGQFGFDSALIHMQNPVKAHYDSAWTANILVGVAIAVTMFLIAKPISLFFNDPRIENVVYSFSILSLAKGFENIGVVNFRKTMQFRGDFLYFVIPKLTAVITGISAAFVLRNYWALVIGMATAQLTTLVYSHVSQPLRPRLALTKFKELFTYSRWILFNNFLQYLAVNSIDIILGRIHNASAVGIYGIARQIAYLPTTELMAPLNRAMFPSFSSIAQDTERVRNVFGKTLSMITLFSIPAAFGIMVLSESIIEVLLGPKWSAASPVLAVLCVVGILQSLASLIFPLLQARGKPQTTTRLMLYLVVMLLPSITIGAMYQGAIGVAIGVMTSYILLNPIQLLALRNEIQFEIKRVLYCVWRPFLSSCAMVYLVHSLEGLYFADTSPTLPTLLLLILSGMLVYGVTILSLWFVSGKPAGAEQEILELLFSKATTFFRSRKSSSS